MYPKLLVFSRYFIASSALIIFPFRFADFILFFQIITELDLFSLIKKLKLCKLFSFLVSENAHSQNPGWVAFFLKRSGSL